MRPLLKPALRRIWRDNTTLQIGLDPDRALVLGGVDPATARFVDTLDGTRERTEAITAAAGLGVDETQATRLLDMFGSEGMLDDASADTRVLFQLGGEERERLRPDLASLSLVGRSPDGGMTALTRRQRASVHVYGAGRVGAPVANLLAAAGVGHLLVTDPEPARLADVAPGGLCPEDVGVRRHDGVKAVLTRNFGGTRVTLPPTRVLPDLAVLAPTLRVNPARANRLMRAGVPHLYVGVRETTGVIGPLVLPGKSSCLRCHDLYRSDKDPAWPRIAAQLSAVDKTEVRACDTVLAVTVAALAVLQLLTFLDGGRPGAVDGTFEVKLPEGQVRRRSWRPHYACGCSWANEEYS
jgi:bacteriocin biosynthesis cyclodehydratase domain-containing protein